MWNEIREDLMTFFNKDEKQPASFDVELHL